MGPEGGRPGRPTQAVRHTCTCSGNLGIVKIFKIAPHKQKYIVNKLFWQKDASPLPKGPYLSTPKHNSKSSTSGLNGIRTHNVGGDRH